MEQSQKYQVMMLLLLSCFLIKVNEVKAQGFTNTVISLAGKVIPAKSSNQVQITLTVFDKEKNKIASAKTFEDKNNYSYFLTGLKPNMEYTILLNGAGFFSQEIEYKTPNTSEYAELSKDFVVQPMEIGYPILVKVAPFDKNKSTIRNGSDYIFEDYISILKNNPKARFTITSYPDNNYDVGFNKSLTEKRAESLKDYFVQSGVPKGRLLAKGEANTDPKNPPPVEKAAKGKRYVGPIYLVVSSN